ncbi:alpha/beta-Hydrolases superfamily protein [Prunus dulcis]|uniref:Alpha/beta-Hydrolases superfamily protein n=1 Tax=Prunus dulcis TaxID=3755 RepID=A0A5H2XXZ8_PRUDU|nr:alpha/beta-Hydrolases superfamily protein [Prunus dulcis]
MDPAAPASSRHQPQPVRRPCCCCLEPLENAAVLADFPTSVSPSSGHQISRVRHQRPN